MWRPKKNKGLGDVVESITEATGIKAVVEFFNDEDISKYSIVKPSILSVYENITKQKTTSKINFDDLISAIKGEISNVE